MRAIFAIAIVGCSSGPPAPRAPIATVPIAATAPAPDAVPISDPAEYSIDRISRDAGKAIFARTGVGDPYRTGMPYP
ncbi:MAG TPA: hypothetical protein VGO00_18190, partial [Kofleriaceae bacterium]|nr:hypothetical protein [Kofleriaceae bacterium]